MKSIACTLLILACAPVMAAQPMADHSTPAINATATAQATGTVRKIDHDRGTVVLAHDPVPSLGWPAMVMPFKASAEQRAAVDVGDTVAFEFDPEGMATLLHIEKR